MEPPIVIVNPVCGDGKAQQFVAEHVLPVLKRQPLATPELVYTTEHPGHAGQIVLKHLEEHGYSSLTVVVAGGDGTVHEIVNAVHEAHHGEGHKIEFVLIPVGTANALFASLFAFCPNPNITSPSYKLQSLHAYLADSVPRPLTVMTTTIGSSASSPRATVRSIVVTSTSLHASILHDSERLRASHPGIERFKMAAEENITKWYSSGVKLLPLLYATSSGNNILEYSPSKSTFVPVITPGSLSLDGPFSYFLSTTNVDRLEPEFCITPLQSRVPAGSPSVDVAIIRPGSKPSSRNTATQFAATVMKVLGGAYTSGSHIDMVYGDDGEVQAAEPGKERTAVLEYYRCGGWEWTPSSGDEAAHLVCADGTILKAEPNDIVRCTVSEPLEDEPRFTVYGR